ncbi:zonular occludens toxin domain-containing protein [Arcobacter porcinus]|uniref:Zonular occludens toxin (Zot) n=1 Tax=Arcobacter porcinus TaxID=1935204 RepID=A0ABX2YIW0_9BACT|nr:zonular occludens toxin domain-containing protein [Arcobacter porcinus]OCL93027.1 Zonular occludens toxin (Zot) [Arcobacter porcinus]
MAITYYTGIPRSGKSLKAVAKIYDIFIAPNIPKTTFLDRLIEKANLDKKETNPYNYCYTNINQFNFSLDERLKKLDFDILLSQLIQLYEIYKNPDLDDSHLLEKTKDFNLDHALFVIDEAHNYFDKKNEVLVWWFTYHGHLYQDIILITQHLSLIPQEYTKYTEYFYKAIPQRFRFSKNVFKYIEYSGAQMYKNQRLGVVSLRVKPAYFEMYVSGATKKDKPIFYKYILLLFFAFSLLVFLFFRLTGSFSQEEEIENINQSENIYLENEIKNQNKDLTTPKPLLDKKSLFRFVCFNEFCYYNSKKDFLEVPISILDNFLKDMDTKDYFTKYRDESLIIYLFAKDEDFDFLNKKNDEQNNKNQLFRK